MCVQTPPEYIPYEFTYEGMLERVSVYQEHQDFCSPHQWPGKEVLLTRKGKQGVDCKTTCYDEGESLTKNLKAEVCSLELLSLRCSWEFKL